MATKITLTEYLGLVTPAWLKGTWGQKWIDGLGGEVDDLVTWAKDGIKSKFPDIAPAGALMYISRDRGIERAIGEEDASFRTRLWRAWETWQWSGTTMGVYYGFESCGFTLSTWITDPWFEWPEDWQATGTVWIVGFNQMVGQAPDDDNTTTHWARFWVALDGYAEGYRETSEFIGDGSLIGEGYAVGIDNVDDPTVADEIVRWSRVIRKWKGSHSTCPSIFLILSAGGWGDIIWPFGALIGDGQTIGGTVIDLEVGEG
jgi:hypothetical protein